MNNLKTFLFSIFITCCISGFSQSDLAIKSTHYKLEKLFFDIDKMYVEEVNKTELTNNLIIGMSNQTPTFCAYQKDSILDHFGITKQNEIESIGIGFKFKGDSLLITEIVKGGAAYNEGILKGDKIISQ